MIKFNQTFTTAGDGYWGDVSKTVKVTHISVPYINDEQDFGELCVHFDTDTWNVDTDGLIYTDSKFLEELQAALTVAGLNAEDVSYSEQGMQGDTYVSLDVGPSFIKSFMDIAPEFAGK
jgi:hypothetical protein